MRGKIVLTSLSANTGMLKKAASGVPCLRRSGFAQAGRHYAVLTCAMYAPRVKER